MESVRKKKILYLNGDARVSPWHELGADPVDPWLCEGWPLARAHEWQPGSEFDAIHVLLVDIDVIANTPGLDDWACKAWRSTFNDLVARATHPDGRSPQLVAYTREPTWDRAITALRVGARDIAKLSKLSEKLRELLALPAAPPLLDDESPSNVVPLFKSSHPGPAPVDDTQPIPRHAIPFPIDGLEGTSPAIEAVRSLVRKTAPLDTSVLVMGPTGSGKERVARALHRYSPRANGPFIAVNCGAIAPGLIESELFGHAKGAFTGAIDERVGFMAAANGGTLFLDEVAELSLETQVKLLRALQERQITPVGSSRAVPLDIRLVASTKRDLDERVSQGLFREDLLYRLRVIELALPALRERRPDIAELSKTILKKLAKRARRPVLVISEETLEKFLLYSWPGNVRELENALEHAASMAWAETRPKVELRDLPEGIQFATMSTHRDQHLKEIVRNFEREYIASTVRRLGSKEQAADSLGLSLATLYRKLGS